MKFIVLTQGDKQIFLNAEELWARHDRASVVRDEPVIANNIGSGQLILIASVNDDATDVELEKEWPELLVKAGGDESQAAAAYAEVYPLVKPAKAAKVDPPVVAPPVTPVKAA